MAYDRFLIAPFKTGLQTDLKPFIIPEDAFQQMNNAYVFRGRVRKRFGSDYTGSDVNTTRLRVNIGTTDGSGNFTIVLGAGMNITPDVTVGVGQQFTVGAVTFTIANPLTSTETMLVNSLIGGTGTFNISTKTVVITGSIINTPVYFYPAEPVMALDRYERGAINDQPAMAFDLQSPYQFDGTSWFWLQGATTTPLFTGTNNDYFWTSNWRGETADDVIFFATNNVDSIWYWDGNDWAELNPVFNSSGDFIITTKIILPYQGYTIMLNTTESISSASTTFVNRARWSKFGSPVDTDSWLIPVQTYMGSTSKGGGVIDAATQEAIIGAEYLKDRLIVYFEESTWELAFTGNGVRPFIWQKINTELGSVGTYSSIPFDKGVLAVGKSGVHAASANVERIDQKIPDEVFLFRVEGNAYNRIHGIRIYQPELAIWSYVEQNSPPFANFSNKVMIYNYANQTWAFLDDCMMCFGYFEQSSDLTWENATMTWEEATFAWNSYYRPAQLRQVIFGNQQGFVCVIEPDLTRNAANMLVTNVVNTSSNIWTFTVINHNLAQDDVIYFENNDYLVFGGEGFYTVFSVTDSNTFIIDTDATGAETIAFIDPPPGVGYQGGMTITRVSRIDIISKQWNPYLEQGLGIYLAKIVFAVSTTAAASIQVDYNSDDSEAAFVQDSGPSGTGALTGTSVLDMFPYAGFDTNGSERLWHPVYFQGQGNCVQIRIYLNNQQILTSESALAAFELDAILLFTMKGVIRFA